jgi:hypothetical protein
VEEYTGDGDACTPFKEEWIASSNRVSSDAVERDSPSRTFESRALNLSLEAFPSAGLLL